MYTLRRILKNGMVINEAIGSSYNFIGKSECREEFEKLSTKWWGDNLPPEEKNIFAYLVYNGGSEIYPLSNSDKYYIMTESGKTFERL